MKPMHVLFQTTRIEIGLNLVLAMGVVVGGLTGFFPLTGCSAVAIAALHIFSLLFHWLVWKQLPVTQLYRLILTLWVLSAFVYTLLVYLFFGPFVLIMGYLLLLFSLCWFVFTCYLLLKEHGFLKRRIELYEQRELIHF
jgi:hypothetical protein